MARPQVSPAVIRSDRLRRGPGRFAFLRGAAGRPLREPPREVAFDLLVRLPERATVLLAMAFSVVAKTTSAPPATLVKIRVGGPRGGPATDGSPAPVSRVIHVMPASNPPRDSRSPRRP